MMCMNYSATSLPALEIRQRLRRNMGMMMQAIEFALTRNVSKALAEAFKMYKDTSFFLHELAKSNGNQGRPAASALIKEGGTVYRRKLLPNNGSRQERHRVHQEDEEEKEYHYR
ncbi:hypothetical protein MRX96_025073 [Rhipicephalus microplus]